jgi:hypothetical protein
MRYSVEVESCGAKTAEMTPADEADTGLVLFGQEWKLYGIGQDELLVVSPTRNATWT